MRVIRPFYVGVEECYCPSDRVLFDVILSFILDAHLFG